MLNGLLIDYWVKTTKLKKERVRSRRMRENVS